jgi:hypothetical protein
VLPGDELIADARIVETRSLGIDAPAAQVWPWLVQMGFGRAGWYSYDKVDMRGSSSDEIRPELQQLEVGQIVPTHPGGGFRVEAIEPDRSLVLYLDTALVHEQATEAAARSAAEHDMPLTPGLQMAGAMGDMTMPEFKGSWTFVLEPEADDRTRLIERLRVWTPESKPLARLGLPFMGYGVFLMTRRQMLGIKQRAERLARETRVAETVAPAAGTATDAAPA